MNNSFFNLKNKLKIITLNALNQNISNTFIIIFIIICFTLYFFIFIKVYNKSKIIIEEIIIKNLFTIDIFSKLLLILKRINLLFVGEFNLNPFINISNS